MKCMKQRMMQFLFSLAAVSVLSFAAGITLAELEAARGWYYGIGLALTALGVFRTLNPPTVGISLSGLRWSRPGHHKDHVGTPHPTA